MIALALDFETQGPDPHTTNITEIGASLKEINGPNINHLGSLSQLVWDESYPPQTPEIVDITGITDEMLKMDGQPPAVALAQLIPYLEKADVIFAHKVAFDKTVLTSMAVRLGIVFPHKEWVCTLTNFPWGEKYRCKQLSHLALDHGLRMDGRETHRALGDVELLFELIHHYDFEKVLAYARTPWVYLKADIPAPWTDGGKGKDAATKLGYGWQKVPRTEGPEFHKTWVKRVKQNELEAERARTPFPVITLEVDVK